MDTLHTLVGLTKAVALLCAWWMLAALCAAIAIGILRSLRPASRPLPTPTTPTITFPRPGRNATAVARQVIAKLEDEAGRGWPYTN